MKSTAFLFRTLIGLVLAFLIAPASRDAIAQEQSQVPIALEEPASPGDPPGYQNRSEIRRKRYHRDEIVVIGRDVHVRANEECDEVIVIGGDANIEGAVRGNVVVVFGSTKVTGTVGRNLVTILGASFLNGKVGDCFFNWFGSPTLGPKAVVERETVAIGGRLKLDPEAVLNGPRTEFALGETFQWLGDWFRKGFLLGRPLPPQVAWAWSVAGIFLILYVLMAIVFPRPLAACVHSLDEAPVATFFVGLFGLILFLPVLVLLAFTVIGVPILILSLIAAVFFGKVAIYQFTGQQLGRQLRLSGLQVPMVALLLGIAIFYLLYTVPVLGFLFWGIGMVWGVGAVLMAVFANFKRESTPAPANGGTAGSVPGMNTPGNSDLPPAFEGSATTIGSIGSVDAIRFARAGFWIRVAATLIDLLLMGVLSAFLGHGASLPFLLLAYHVGMWSWRGTTIGGIVFGLKVVRLDGRDIEFSVALVRGLFSIVSAVFFFFGFFWA